MTLIATGMAQAATWTEVTTDWNSTTAWDTGIVPDGVGEIALIDKAPNPNLGGNTITLGSNISKWSIRTGGTGNRVFDNGAIKIERTSTAATYASNG